MNVGGPALQISGLMRGLDAERFDHRLFSGSVEPGEADYIDLCAPDVAVQRLPHLGRSVRPGDDARALAQLTAAMRDFRPHILHTHTAKAGVLGRLAGLLARVPVRVHTFHGHLLHGYFSGPKTQLVIRTERTLARLTDHLIAVSEQVRDDLVAARIGAVGRYHVVPPGTGLGPLPGRTAARLELGLPVAGPVVAYVGRITRIKRPDRLVQILRLVRREVPDATLVVCGDGDLSGEFMAAAAAADLGAAIAALGWRRDVATVYAASDLVLLASDNEGLPVSLIEAGMAGLPCVATRVGGVPEVVKDGTTGLLAPPGAQALATQVVRLLRDEPLRRQMGLRAREWTTERFGTARLVSDTDDLYSSIAVAKGWWPVSTQSPARPAMQPSAPPSTRLSAPPSVRPSAQPPLEESR